MQVDDAGKDIVPSQIHLGEGAFGNATVLNGDGPRLHGTVSQDSSASKAQ